jgi:hypothetical protein
MFLDALHQKGLDERGFCSADETESMLQNYACDPIVNSN